MSEQLQPLVPGIDLSAVRLTAQFGEALSVKRLVNRIPVRKPLKTEFFRARKGASWRLDAMILEMKEDGETYLLTADAWNVLPGLERPATLYTAIDRRNNVFMVPVPLPGPDGRRNSWHQSMVDVVALAESNWVRAIANKAVGGYDVMSAQATLSEPEWPNLSLQELIDIAFRGRIS